MASAAAAITITLNDNPYALPANSEKQFYFGQKTVNRKIPNVALLFQSELGPKALKMPCFSISI